VRVVVVGARGFIGGVLCARLRASGLDVVGSSSRDGTGLDAVSGLPCEGFPELRAGDCVVYLAQSPHYRDLPASPWRLLGLNAFGPAHVARRAVEAGAERFLLMSTGNVYAPSFAPLDEDAPVRRDGWYPLSKLCGENAVRFYREEMAVCVVRLFGVYGPCQERALVPNLARALLAGRPITIQGNPADPEDRDGLRVSFCHVEDAVRALEVLITQEGPETVNIGGTAPASIRQVASRLAAELGTEPRFEHAAAQREGDLVADTSTLSRLTDWQPRPVEEGIAQTVQSLRAHL